jgi:hypothetical protein
MNRRLLHDIERAVEYIDDMLYNPGIRWDALVESTRNLMALLDSTPFFGGPSGVDLQINTVDVIQKLAYQNVDQGGIGDVADWCLERWLRILQRNPDNVQSLKGTVDEPRFRLESLLKIYQGSDNGGCQKLSRACQESMLQMAVPLRVKRAGAGMAVTPRLGPTARKSGMRHMPPQKRNLGFIRQTTSRLVASFFPPQNTCVALLTKPRTSTS